MINYKKYVNEVPDFPKEGISFKDISPMLADSSVYKSAIVEMGELVLKNGVSRKVDYWVGIDSRGFLFASSLSFAYGGGILMCRKGGKLPPTVVHLGYDLEYGSDSLEIKPGEGNVIIVDDVLATGGTLQTTKDLCCIAGYNVVGTVVLIDLQYVPRWDGFFLENVKSLIQYL